MTDRAKYKIILADDHPLLLKGLAEIIKEEEDYEIIGQAYNGEQALLLVEKHHPDVIVLDIDMPKLTGLELAEKIVIKNVNTKIVFLTMHNKESIFNKAMSLGAYAYLMKDSALVEIIEALSAVVKGKKFVSKSLTDLLIKKSIVQPIDNPLTQINVLTATELKILKLVAKQKSTKEIAEELTISSRTVETHRSNICAKLELKGTNSLLKFALENKDILHN